MMRISEIVIAIEIDIAFVCFSAFCFRSNRKDLTDSEVGWAADTI